MVFVFVLVLSLVFVFFFFIVLVMAKVRAKFKEIMHQPSKRNILDLFVVMTIKKQAQSSSEKLK